MNQDIKYINLIRKLHRVEREIQDFIPMEHIDLTFEEMSTGKLSSKPFEPTFEDLLPDEMTRIGYRKLKEKKFNVLVEIALLLGREKYKQFHEEYYADSIPNDGSYEGIMVGGEIGKPMYMPKNPISRVATWGGEDNITIRKDAFPTTYGVSHYPIDDEKKRGRKTETYRVEINGLETTIKKDAYYFMMHISNEYQDKAFHPMHLIYDLNEDGVLEKDYQGKLYDLFDGNRELVKILFDYINKPKGYWMCKVQYWFDLDKS